MPRHIVSSSEMAQCIAEEAMLRQIAMPQCIAMGGNAAAHCLLPLGDAAVCRRGGDAMVHPPSLAMPQLIAEEARYIAS